MNEETEVQWGKELTQGSRTSGDTARTSTPQLVAGILVLLYHSFCGGEKVVYKGGPGRWGPVELSEEGEQG